MPMPNQPYQPILQLTRGSVVESIHYGSVAVSDASGRLVAWYGNPRTVTYLRSSAKPFQALPFIEHGGQAAFHLEPREIALICASHAGTDEHVAVLQRIQAKTGVQETDLMCGTHPLGHEPTIEAMRRRGETVTPNRHNCSGKHTGMLSYIQLKRMRGEALPAGLPYIAPEHPLQQEIKGTFAEMCGLPVDKVAVGVDGCSAPNFAVPLRSAAWACARLCDPSGLSAERAQACRTIVMSMMAHPFMVSGPDGFDTRLMETAGGKIVCKGGAEGYQAIGILPGAIGPGSPALGIALKISDGDLGGHASAHDGYHGSARPAVVLEVLRQLGALSTSELETLSGYGPTFKLQNWREIEVGQGRACFQLERK